MFSWGLLQNCAVFRLLSTQFYSLTFLHGCWLENQKHFILNILQAYLESTLRLTNLQHWVNLRNWGGAGNKRCLVRNTSHLFIQVCSPSVYCSIPCSMDCVTRGLCPVISQGSQQETEEWKKKAIRVFITQAPSLCCQVWVMAAILYWSPSLQRVTPLLCPQLHLSPVSPNCLPSPHSVLAPLSRDINDSCLLWGLESFI